MAERSKIFGTDGVRGTANVYPMTAEVALSLGRAAAHVFRGQGSARHQIIIGKDTRLSGYVFEDALTAGICSMGVDVLVVGPMPTPAMAFLTADMRCDAGVMISASHNPYQDNGIKFFSHDGYKLPDEIEARIEGLIESPDFEAIRAGADEIGQVTRIDDCEGRYVVFLKHTFPPDRTLDGLKVVLDCANGAAYKVGPAVFRELGAELTVIGADPNGRNINEGVGAMHPENAAAVVREVGADIGICLDGDADRCILIAENGEVVDGDAVMALCAEDLHGRGALKGGGVVGTVMSNLGLQVFLQGHGLELVRAPVGDRYVLEAMRAKGYNLGGEQSGHILFLDHNRTGDGLITALQVIATMLRSERPLSELGNRMTRFPQTLVNFEVAEKRPLEDLPDFQKALRAVEADLGERGRVLVRYSGTEKKARVMVEGEDQGRVDEIARDLAETLQRALAG
ncbi:MAG: phosphoglucosamine mutase [Deltaproteobacteria bacterium]|nr:phosphoglucosamine mutase [Deltaproteobacteria bacterium]MBW2447112.1 phosphoglucosamine mutase [Deltaproteobacteria bacterium]